MGVITVFSITGCPHCAIVMKALKMRTVPYVEINLTLHPEKRIDLLSLCDSFSVPQVFFNNKHIGGAIETLKLLRQWDDEDYNSNDDNTDTNTDSDESCTGDDKDNDIDDDKDKIVDGAVILSKDCPDSGAVKWYKREIEPLPNPTDRRYAVPHRPPDPLSEYWMVDPVRGEEDWILIPGLGEDSARERSQSISVVEMISRLDIAFRNSNGFINKIRRRGYTYTNVLPQSRILAILTTEFSNNNTSNDPEKWKQLLINLQERQILRSLDVHPHPHLRLQPHHTPIILNSYRIWTNPPDGNPLALVRRLTHQLNAITNRSIRTPHSQTKLKTGDEAEGVVHLPTVRADSEYDRFQEGCCALQKINLFKLSTHARIALITNIYNLMIRYAQIKIGIVPPSSPYQRHVYMTEIQINIGSLTYSFHDLESGILRGNRRPPSYFSFTPPFKKGDPRLASVVDDPDPRCLFGLDRNGRWLDLHPIRDLTEEGLKEELRVITLDFCDSNHNVDLDINWWCGCGGVLRLSQILEWYMGDFVGSKGMNELPWVILEFLRGQRKKVLADMLGGVDESYVKEEESRRRTLSGKVQFIPFDWSCSSDSQGKIFTRKDLYPDHFSMKALFS